MKSCKGIQNLILDYIEGALPNHLEEGVREHVTICSECRTYLETLSVTAKRVEILLNNSARNINPPPLLWGKILSEVQKTKQKRAVSWWKVAVTTCATIAILLTGTLAPVFGYEGNLLNVISGQIIENSTSELEKIIGDDLLGSLRKNEIFKQVANEAGLSQEDIWELRSKNYTNREIIQCCKIATNSNWTIDEVISKHDEGHGLGRIANWAGISVFSVSNEIAKPINNMRNEIENKTEFEINTEVAGIDESNKLISPILNESVQIPDDIVDENGKAIPSDEISDSYVSLKFRFDGNKPRVHQITKHNKYPTKHFRFSGKIVSINDDVLTVQNPNGKSFTVKLIRGESSIFGKLTEGQSVRISGFETRDGGKIARLIKPVQEGGAKLPPRVAFNDKNNTPKPEIKATPEKTIEAKPADKPAPEDNNPVPISPDEPVNEEPENEDSDKPINNMFANKTVTLTHIKNDVMETNLGNYNIKNTEVMLNISGKNHPMSKEILSLLQPDFTLRINGKGDTISTLVIPKSSLKTEIFILRDFDVSKNICHIIRPRFEKREIKTNSSTVFIPENKELISGCKVEISTLPNVADVALVIRTVSRPLPAIHGVIENIDRNNIRVNGQTFTIDPAMTSILKRDRGNMKPVELKSLKPGTKVELIMTEIDGKPIVLKIIAGSDSGHKINALRVKSTNYLANENRLVIMFSTGAKIMVTDKTRIFVEFQLGRSNKISLDELVSQNLQGRMIKVKRDKKGIVEITVLHQ